MWAAAAASKKLKLVSGLDHELGSVYGADVSRDGRWVLAYVTPYLMGSKMKRGRFLAAMTLWSARHWPWTIHRQWQIEDMHAGTGVSIARFSPDGLRIASGGMDGRVTVYDIFTKSTSAKKGQVFELGHPKGNWSHARIKAFSNPHMKEALYVSSNFDGSLSVWSSSGTSPPRPVVVSCSGRVAGFALSEDGTLLSAVGDGFLKMWNAGTGELIYEKNSDRIYTSVSMSGLRPRASFGLQPAPSDL
eukprot:tig00000113_g5595.t1